MAQQVIGIGTLANDGSGDPVRTAFNKINLNFTEVYAYTTATTGLNTQAGASYTLTLADAGDVVEGNSASAQTFTVPPNSTAAFPLNTVILIRQYGAGKVTLAPGAGVTIRARGAVLGLAGQYAEASLTKRATDEWVLSGDLG